MDIKLPSLGEGADSGTVVNILVKEGEQIAKDQPILELETEKAVGTVPSSAAGTVTGIGVKVGDKVSAGQTILTLDGGGEPTKPNQKPKPKAEARPQPASAPSPAPAGYKPVPGVPAPAAPSVRKIAHELGIDLGRVQGSEHGGRITLTDVRAYVERLQAAAFQHEGAPGQPARPVAEKIDFGKWGSIAKRPMTPVRKTIARRLTESWTTIPHVTQFDEADITGLNDLRKKHAKAYEDKGARLTLTSFALKAVLAVLKKHPMFNASLDETSDEIVVKEYYHFGVAVDTEHGLIVPVLRDVDKKNMFKLSSELEELAGKARDRKLSVDEMKGSSFTISNQGGIGGAHFTPIINKPDVAILGIGRGALKPVVVNGKIETRLMMPLALSYDHRVVDGAQAARFIVDLVAAFEHFPETEVRI
jgi:pyruvate dehydrogenase E2 component (dihydrolipoamide acetyltransferase)